MLKNLQSKKEQGFTIIEVLIVLAVGGLIIAIVLLAVPALQRNQRNSARATDASRIATAAANFSADNNGRMPTTTSAASILTDAGQLGQYTLTAGATAGVNTFNVTTTSVGTAPTNSDQVTLVVAAKCGTTSGTTTSTGANARQMALLYTVETTGTPKAICLEV